MRVTADVCVVPMGVGASVSEEVSVAYRILSEAGVAVRLHAHGTNVEGDFDAVMSAVRRCHEALHARGVARVVTTMKIGTRIDKDESTEGKVASVRRLVSEAASEASNEE